MFSLHKFLDQMSELNKMIKCSGQEEVFAWLSKMVTGSGNFIAQQGEMIKKYLADYMQYHLDEYDSYKELYNVRESTKSQYIK